MEDLSQEQLAAYQALVAAGENLAEASRAFAKVNERHIEAHMLHAMCCSISGMLMAPCTWSRELPPLSAACQESAIRNVRYLERAIAEEAMPPS